MAFRSIMLFQAADQQAGWSEVYTLDYDQITDAVSALDRLAVVRARILSQDNKIIGYRVTAPLDALQPGFIRRQRKAYLTTRDIPGNAITGNSKSSDLVWTGVMLRLNDGTRTVFRNQIYRGVLDSLWDGGDDSNARSTMQKGFLAQWQAALIGANAKINHKIRPAGTALTSIQIVDYIRMVRRATGRAFGALRGRR